MGYTQVLEKGDYGDMSEEREYTIDDILALPDGQRAELFDGEMIMMATPTTVHQEIIGELYYEIVSTIKSRKDACRVIVSPYGVFIKKDRKNYVEPDISIICDKEKIDNQGCHGAPDWAVEVVSPSSKKLDYKRKLALYIETGMREYWVVDSEKKVIVVYRLEQPESPAIYPFGETIPVGILEDFAVDTKALAELPEY